MLLPLHSLDWPGANWNHLYGPLTELGVIVSRPSEKMGGREEEVGNGSRDQGTVESTSLVDPVLFLLHGKHEFITTVASV